DPVTMILAWDGASQTLRRLLPPTVPSADASELVVESPVDGARLAPGEMTVDVRADRSRRFRLTVVAQGNATIADLPGISVSDGRVRLEMPAAFVTTMARLYPGGEFFWWLEASGAAGEPVGFTRMRSFRLAIR